MITEYSRRKTFAKVDKLRKQLPEISQRISAARAQGGIDENEELHAALEDLQRKQMEISRLENIANGPIIHLPQPGKSKKIEVGTTMTLLNLDDDTQIKYTILGEYESDPENGIISAASPFAKEFMDAKNSDVIYFERGNRSFEYKVIDICFECCEKIFEK